MKSWKIALALGMSALVLSGCGGKGNSSSKSDSAQVCPAYYFDFENESFYYVDNALAKKPKSYPFPSDYLFSNSKGCITEDGKWIYVYGTDPNQDIKYSNGQVEQRCLYRFPTEGLKKDPAKNQALLQKIDIGYAVTYNSPMLPLPDGSILLVVDDVGNENSHAVYHLTDSENEQLLDDYTEYEIIDDDTVLYRVYPNRYGSISYDEAEGKVKKSEITLEEGAEVFERNETTVYYYVSGYRTLDFYRAEYDGTVTGLGKLDCGEYDHNNSKFEINSNGELFIALRKKEILDWLGHYKDYYTIYRTDGGSVKEVVEKAIHPHFSNGFCMYNKLDDEEEKLFCITGNENETELQGFNGELYFMRETEDGSTILFELDETTYYAKRDNLTLTDAKQTGGDVSLFYFVGNVPYFKQNGNLYCIKDGELSLAVEGIDKYKDVRIAEDGCIIIGWLDGDNHVFSFYKNGEQIGEISGPNIYEGTHYIADSTFVYSDDKEGGSFLDITTHVVHLSSKGVKMVNEFPGGSFFCFKKPLTEYLEKYYVY